MTKHIKNGKRRMGISRLLAVALALLLVLLPACSSTTEQPAAAPSNNEAGSTPPAEVPGETDTPAAGGSYDTSNLNEPGTFPILKETVPISIGVLTDTNIIDMDTNVYTQMLEESVNVDLEFIYFPAIEEERWQKLSVMISSGGELPDTISFRLTDLQTYTWGSQGYFQPVNGMMDELSIYAKPLLDEYKDVYGLYYNSPDGNMYGLPRVVEDLGNDWGSRIWINETWLNNLNLDMPSTTDEFYQVMKAFKEQDPNGNGQSDEIPLIASKDNWNGLVWPSFLNAFTYVNTEFDYLQVENGKLQGAFTQDGWRDGLEWLNQLCEEGLLSPLTFTQDQNQLKQILENADDQIVGCLTTGSMSIYQMESERKKDMTSMPPLTGPDGINYTNYHAAGIPGQFGFITKDCKDPVAAFMMFDYMYNEDMIAQGRFGTKGVNWEDPAPDDVSVFAAAGYDAKIKYIGDPIWGTMQNEFWGENHPTFRTNDYICGLVDSGNPYDYMYMTANAVPKYMGKVPAETVERIIYTQEEADQIADIKATIRTYVRENAVAFITGSRPISDWDNYIKDLENIGLEEYLEVSQIAFDRMKENS